MIAEAQLPTQIAASAEDSQRVHAEEVLKAAASRGDARHGANDESGGDPYNTADRKLPKHVPWAHLVKNN